MQQISFGKSIGSLAGSSDSCFHVRSAGQQGTINCKDGIAKVSVPIESILPGLPGGLNQSPERTVSLSGCSSCQQQNTLVYF